MVLSFTCKPDSWFSISWGQKEYRVKQIWVQHLSLSKSDNSNLFCTADLLYFLSRFNLFGYVLPTCWIKSKPSNRRSTSQWYFPLGMASVLKHTGSGCGAFGRAVASDTSHWQNLHWTLLTVNWIEKTEIKKNEDGNGPFWRINLSRCNEPVRMVFYLCYLFLILRLSWFESLRRPK